jgi:dynein heavy chain
METSKKKIVGDELVKIEEKLMYKALKDMNLSKLVNDDVKLFESLLDDVFVNTNKENKPNEHVLKMVQETIKEKSLIIEGINTDIWLNKIMQL